MIFFPNLDSRFRAAINVISAIAVSIFTLAGSPATHAQSCAVPVGAFYSIQGEAFIQSKPAVVGQLVCPDERIEVTRESRAGIFMMQTETVVRVNELTTLSFKAVGTNESFISIIKGIIHLFTREPTKFDFTTPYTNAMVEGTEFVVDATATETTITVIEGSVRVENTVNGEALVVGESAEGLSTASGTLSSRETEPLNRAVFWAIHYPRVSDLGAASDTIKQVSRLLTRGLYGSAVGLLDSILNDDPRNADALAFQSIIATSQGRLNDAITQAENAVSIDPLSSLSFAALSYAQQASFDLSAARQSAWQSVQINNRDLFALTRLAEVEISQGDFQSALSHAQRAVEIDPDYSRSYTMIGFIHLNLRDTRDASEAFELAIAKDNSDPMPRLGLGLVMIKNNRLEAGRRLIELAVSLDPVNSLFRSYLGKAYYEEARPLLADEQFSLAKKFDVNDPTPWYYDAISRSPDSTPIDELDNLNQSIRLNDNRTIYRSRLALDSDLATRGVNLSQLYQQLGFNRLASIEATRSLGIDPSSHSAHRFLSGAYARLPRHEVARVSELLQSQLLNPMNTDPLPPSSSFLYTDSALESGASLQPGNFEYTSVFERNGPRLRAAVEAGEHGQFNGDIAGSWLNNNTLISAGISKYDSDGYRNNNDATSEIHNVFSQWTPNSRLSVQAEYRHRSTQQGDLRQNFGIDTFSESLRRDIRSEILRFGTNFQISPGSTLLLSGVESQIDTELADTFLFPDTSLLSFENFSETEARQLELQHLLTRDESSLVTGIGGVKSDLSFTTISELNGTLLSPTNADLKRQEFNAYLYYYRHLNTDLDIVLGAGYSRQEVDQSNNNLWQPKIGLLWQINENAGLRFAYFKSLKRFLIADQSIEPTQIAGFNQLFDDTDGTESERLGVAVDLQPNSRLALSLEVSQRNSDFILAEQIHDRRERILNASASWTISRHLTLTTEFNVDHYDNRNPPANEVNTVTQLRTLRAPVSLNYYFDNSAYVRLTSLFLHQNLSRHELSTFPSGNTKTVLGSLAMGYTFANGKAHIALGIHNFTDTRFRYQDERFRSAQVIQPTELVPERRIALQATYQFN